MVKTYSRKKFCDLIFKGHLIIVTEIIINSIYRDKNKKVRPYYTANCAEIFDGDTEPYSDSVDAIAECKRKINKQKRKA